MEYGFIKCAAASFDIAIADPIKNGESIVDTVLSCNEAGVKLLVFPELSLTGYTCGDLFFSKTLIDGAKTALIGVLEKTERTDTVFTVGMPVCVDSKLYDCAVVCHKGQVQGIVPKKYIPGGSELSKYFTPAPKQYRVLYNYLTDSDGCPCQIPFGSNIIFEDTGCENFKFGIELSDDNETVNTPGGELCSAGAKIILNPSAKHQIPGRDREREELVKSNSKRLICGYIRAEADPTESTQNVVYSSNHIIAENGVILSENSAFGKDRVIITDIDVDCIASCRMKNSLYTEYSRLYDKDDQCLEAEFTCELGKTPLHRHYDENPFIPSGFTDKDAEEILNTQVMGLYRRIRLIDPKTAVIGISGGLDSTLALLVAYYAGIKAGKNDFVTAVMMPCFGTSERTRGNAERLCTALGIKPVVVNIAESVKKHFEDIGLDENDRGAAFENAQARERTQVLMDIANKDGGFVVGTGDLSELALGFCTYNGDQMSMYSVNASVPKTLMRRIIEAEANKALKNGNEPLHHVLLDILYTPVSPELLPPKNGEIAQITEEIVGPYELHDFFIYYTVYMGFTKEKTLYIARQALGHKYTAEVTERWYEVFIRRFFTQQFKRACAPDGVKATQVSFNPRGDFSMPSEASYKLFK